MGRFFWMLRSDTNIDGSRAGCCMVGVKYYKSKGSVTYPGGNVEMVFSCRFENVYGAVGVSYGLTPPD